MRDDLLKKLSGHRDLTNVVVLTYNIDLIFVEHVFLRAMKRCGHPTLTIFADAEEVSRTFESQGRWLAGIGRRYRVVTVAMSAGYRFHPKAALLSGPEHAELLVGSGNLTFGGLRQNDEIWMSFSDEEDGTGPMAAFQSLLVSCADQAGASRGAQREIEEAFDVSTHTWAAELADPDGIVWRMGAGPTLTDQMATALGSREVDRLVVCSPYFDQAGVALGELQQTWPGVRIDLLVQPKQSTLTESALEHLPARPRLLTMSSGRQQHAEAFIHGKFYAFYSGGQVFIFTGSANCSAAAMGLHGQGGNAEILSYRTVSAETFEGAILSELRVVDDPPLLPQAFEEEDEGHSTRPLEILSAIYDHGNLALSFRASSDVTIEECWLDGDEHVKLCSESCSDKAISLELAAGPRTVQLIGTSGGTRVVSRSHWVDHEFKLSATSRQRKLAQAIEGSVSPSSWSFRSWIEVIRLLGDQLRYEPANRGHSDCKTQKKRGGEQVYRPGDFFTNDYRLPSRHAVGVSGHEDDRILGLQALLLEYFGVETGDIDAISMENETLDDDEAVDLPEHVRPGATQSSVRRRKPQDQTEAEQKRARRITTKLIAQILDEGFLRHRNEGLLANDLTIIAVLLIAGMNEKWLTDDLFFKLTYDVWTSLFFDHGLSHEDGEDAKGWLQLRVEDASEPDAFREAVGTVPLTAALAIWSFICPHSASRSEQARFALANRMAVARLPWLWNVERIDEVAEEIARIAARTGWVKGRSVSEWTSIQEAWDCMLHEGLVLGTFEQCLEKRTASEWRDITERTEIGPATLIWQGKLGFGVTTRGSDCGCEAASAVPVLFLKAQKRQAQIKPSYMLPVRHLVQTIIRMEDTLDAEDAAALDRFVGHLESLLSAETS